MATWLPVVRNVYIVFKMFECRRSSTNTIDRFYEAFLFPRNENFQKILGLSRFQILNLSKFLTLNWKLTWLPILKLNNPAFLIWNVRIIWSIVLHVKMTWLLQQRKCKVLENWFREESYRGIISKTHSQNTERLEKLLVEVGGT